MKLGLATTSLLDKLIFINDFVAQSLCFSTFYKDLTIDPSLNNKTALNNNLDIVRPGIPIIKAPLLVTGPGTGLGVCTLLNLHGSSIAIEGEGGHSSFAPNSDIEVELLQFLRKKYDHVSNERIVSGSGIEEIFNFIQVCPKEMVDKLKTSVLNYVWIFFLARDEVNIIDIIFTITIDQIETASTNTFNSRL